MTWKFTQIGKIPELKNPILIEGMPGIGNVGKVTADFIVEQLKAVKIYDVFSYKFPHSVFVNENNLIELPTIEIYYKRFTKKGKTNDLIILTGDIQPIDEESCYEFCDAIIDLLLKFKGTEIITLGGVGLMEVSNPPQVYCTGNNKEIIQKYVIGTAAKNKLYGIIGPIIGVSGVLLGMAGKKKVPAATLLAETLAHPMSLGIAGAKEILTILNKKLSLEIDIKKLDKEIKDLEEEMLKTTKELEEVSKQSAVNKLKQQLSTDANYIG
ncbi:PAC2 family protein [Candidatus Woesearchaeota archaeon]|nr:PAC2 family protein [Candidatus Woesearchaeota archaeon]